MTIRADGDDELIAAVAGGDRDALAELYRRHAPWLVLRLSRRCADPGMVEEVVQDTFVAVWRGADRYRASGEIPAWIWGIGIRRLISRLRQRPVALAPRRDDTLVSAEDEVLIGVEHEDLGPRSARSRRSFGQWYRPRFSMD